MKMHAKRLGWGLACVAALTVAVIFLSKRRKPQTAVGTIHLGEVRIEGRAGVSAVWNVTHGHTGREVRGDPRYALAAEWANVDSRDKLLVHPACREFVDQLTCVQRLSDSSIRFFRGCPNNGKLRKSDEMGPPPNDPRINAGRYNRQGEGVLYLCDSEYGVLRELSGSPVLDIQRFLIPVDQLVIADFASIPSDHFVTQVFSKAEECMVEGRGPMSYVFSQTIAELVGKRFDGMRIPGVRGKPGAYYSNVVIFRPHADWLQWLDLRCQPYTLAAHKGIPKV